MLKPFQYFFTDRSNTVSNLLWIFLLCYLCFMFVLVMLSCLFFAALSSPAWKGLTTWLSCVVGFSCVFVSFPYGVLGQWVLIYRFLIFAFLFTYIFIKKKPSGLFSPSVLFTSVCKRRHTLFVYEFQNLMSWSKSWK